MKRITTRRLITAEQALRLQAEREAIEKEFPPEPMIKHRNFGLFSIEENRLPLQRPFPFRVISHKFPKWLGGFYAPWGSWQRTRVHAVLSWLGYLWDAHIELKQEDREP